MMTVHTVNTVNCIFGTATAVNWEGANNDAVLRDVGRVDQ